MRQYLSLSIKQLFLFAVSSALVVGASLNAPVFATQSQDLPNVKKDLGECFRSPSPEKAVDACTGLLNSGRLSGSGLAAAHFLRALAYMGMGRNAHAKEDMSEAAKIDPDGVFGLISRGTIDCDKKQSETAITSFSEAIRQSPKLSLGYLMRGTCFRWLGQNQEAVQDLTKTIEMSGGSARPANAFVYQMRGEALAAAGRTEEAQQDLSKALQMDNRLAAGIYNDRANIHAEQRKWLSAAEEFGRSAALHPTIAFGFKRQGDALDNAGHSREAIAAYNKAIGLEKNPKLLAEYHLDRAAAFSNLDEWQEALEDYDAATRLNPNGNAYRRKGAALVISGRPAEGVADLRKATELDPKDAYAVLWLAVAEAKLGRVDLEELKGLVKALDPVWPSDIVRVLINERSADEPISIAGLNELHAKGHQCELDFYVGAFRLAQGERDQGIRRLQAAVASGVREYIEYQAAKVELKRMGVAIPASQN
jgi:tetratricopeptide (TPR) repeat protein